MAQLKALSHRYLSHTTPPFRICLVYVSRSNKCVDSPPIPLSEWEARLNGSRTAPLAPKEVAKFLDGYDGAKVLVDSTATQELPDSYAYLLKRGISIVTPNKKAFSSDIDLWDSIFSAAANGGGDPKTSGYLFHEATVGAGLPIISSLKELLETDDVVTKIEGVFSGTLSYLFNSLMPVNGQHSGGSFSAEVQKAKTLGYTEPDPRDDLYGLDVGRKLTILARIAGLRVASPTSFPIQSLVPKELEACPSGDEFVARLVDFDGEFEAVKHEALSEGKLLRYVGSIDLSEGRLEVGLQKFDPSNPICGLKGTECIVSFHTKRYGDSPLVIQGSGEPEPTAMGVTGDFIKVCNMLRLRSL